jgi:hypothetical protein
MKGGAGGCRILLFFNVAADMICAEVTNMKLSVALLLFELRKGEAAIGSRTIISPMKTPAYRVSASSGTNRSGRCPVYRIRCRYPASGSAAAHLFAAGVPDAHGTGGTVYIDQPLSALINAVEDIFYRYNQIERS